jgi:GTP cyclohydrolase I
MIDQQEHDTASIAEWRERACAELIETLDASEIDIDTPGRMARALGDLTSGYATTDFAAILKTFPLAGDPGIVAVRNIPFASLCEHHVLPFTGIASVAYLPSDRIVGLSKIPRLVRAVTRRLQVQERIGTMIADALMAHIHALGVVVILKAQHSCMAISGAESPGEMVTSTVRGVFMQEPMARAEVMELLRG